MYSLLDNDLYKELTIVIPEDCCRCPFCNVRENGAMMDDFFCNAFGEPKILKQDSACNVIKLEDCPGAGNYRLIKEI